ncbi:hypothetical protein HanRHA438_Chr03g0099841 [Helianthus annuus]|uniref:Uncharacterized protein n=1 Tax=Helianthus annuus TaxID=4232 RepID=A0A9K3JBS2_HELAN|nr:hypothetical protein HanXRQr2_Chr03g0088691 [Helianthus annuus]KAJ0495797.1 hypothetical protein HanIR_Chr12g0612961 [Helianthus annuus]KAJ0591562.1 hypothetical protein HanHA300_Chr03g0074671 [Helianthus annuus]KAJ0606453.1 hypothetical protein HanHA89_Chr03g0085281 [Helianthus annuus]KAJ0766542.1 hypothetical protein HanLR1_Chr03g0078781 [Helianthus annuus]
MFERTKKFFKKSIQTFKSYFSEGYERLPKAPSYKGHNNTGYSLENVYSEFVNEWEATERVMAISYDKNKNNLNHKKQPMMIGYHEVDKRKQEKHEDTSSREREERKCLVTKRLKELEILDMNNVDHVLDIQEVLHFYSRLTCPTYCEIVEKYFTEMYSEVLTLPHPSNSRPRRMAIRV